MDSLEAYHLHEREWERYSELYEAFEWEVPASFNVAEYVCDRWAENGERDALYAENAAGDESVYTYRELRDVSNRIANWLAGRGVEHGDRVALNLPQRPETILCHLGCWKLGAATVPMSTLFGPDALRHRLRDAGPRVCVVDESNVGSLRAVVDDVPGLDTVLTVGDVTHRPAETDLWEAISSQSTEYETADTAAEDDLLLMYTSGTTGAPKGVLHAHRFVLGHLPAFLVIFCDMSLRDDAVFWSPSEWAWVAIFDYVIPPLFFGRRVLSYDGGPFDRDTAFRLVEKYGVTNLFVPPTALRKMREGGTGGHSVESVAVVTSGAEPMGEDVVRWVDDAFGGAVLNEAYGQTEANLLVGTCDALMDLPTGTLGRPMPGHEVAVVDPDDPGRECDPGEVGEIAVRFEGDPVCMKEYWGRPEATARKIQDGLLLTEDLGTVDADGVFTFHSRKDDVIISAGYRIGPSEIEETLAGHDAVADAGVIGVPHDERGEVPKAFVVPSAGHEPSGTLRDTLVTHVKETLARYEYPRDIEFVDELPTTATGKVRRVDLERREGLVD